MTPSTDDAREKIASSLGRISLEWASLERELGFHLEMYHSFNDRRAMFVVLSELDVRARIRIAKQLAFLFGPSHIFDGFENAMNAIDNELRGARNTLIHDTITFWFDDIRITKQKSRIVKPKAFAREWEMMSHKETSIEEVALVADCITRAGEYVSAYWAHTHHLRGNFNANADKDRDPHNYMVEHATPDFYESALAAFLEAMTEYRRVTK